MGSGRTADLAAAALRYARLGWHVHPCAASGKVPATAHGWKDATTDPQVISVWWADTPDANIGCATGPSGLLVIDLDGDEGQATWANLAARHEGHPPTPVAETGSGGLHVYFAGDGPSTVGRLGDQIDTRGRGGYIILPPSIHPNGRAYTWRPTVAQRPAAAPGWLLDALRPPPPPPIGPHRPPPPEGATPYGRAALAGMVADVRGAAERTRHWTLIRIAYRAGRLVAAGDLAIHDAREALVGAALDAGLGRGEANRTVRDGLLAGQAFPR